MPLKTIVKVGSVTNLSDARYCSGMGVDMLGFRVIEDQPNYVSPALYQEIRGWIAGPVVVAEVYGLKDESAISNIQDSYRPDFMECSIAELPHLQNLTGIKLIISLTDAGELKQLRSLREKVAYVLVQANDIELINRISSEFPTLAEIQFPDALKNVLKIQSLKGIALHGENEIRPGLKAYEHLSEILEQLETD